MVDPLEFPDLKPKSQLPEKVKALVRSNPEHEKNGFSKALKEKLEEELEEENRKKHEDSLELTEANHDEQENKEESEDSSEPAEPSDDEPSDDEPAEPAAEHIDLKA